MNHCGDGNPIEWLTENWNNMIETVMTLASNVGHEAEENTVGRIYSRRKYYCYHQNAKKICYPLKLVIFPILNFESNQQQEVV